MPVSRCIGCQWYPCTALPFDVPSRCIKEALLPREAPEKPAILLACRGQHDEVGFMEVNAVTARV
ncbi:HvfC family peptide modification chaperone [Microbulbifer hainanensis]|uniref:HvfC family peptide modification chaperone n=1 Tax=Microbulbifer hainanensis TaxID=2735675 RepID=UPI003857331D